MIVVAISGASGSVLGIRLIEELLNMDEEVYSVLSESAKKIIKHELFYDAEKENSLKPLLEKRGRTSKYNKLNELSNNNFFSPPASGSTDFEAAVVMPCSMKSLSAISNGFADCLITRCCDVALKEKKRCILVTRETPLNLIHIENMRTVVLAGGEIVPPVPGYYTLPKTVDDIVNFSVGKVLNLLGKKHSLFESWKETSKKLKLS